ncbi:acyltransferase domain-containing protein [Embleya sp. AB8]|uniref:acyltransferase domain-containing protein n=1 Tax=Embleya sp. AB8 TaxID=3156304 RepID=UPI003C773945
MTTSPAYAWMFPNPGAHLPGALRPLTDGLTGFCALKKVDEVAAEYGWGPVSPLLQDGFGPQDRPEHFWLGFYATSLALTAHLREAGVRCDVMLGHSSGEVSALVAAGSVSPEDGARLLCERIKAVERTPLPEGAMIVLDSNVGRTEHMCAAVGDPSLVIAVDNGPHQVVVSGWSDAVTALERLAGALDVRATRHKAPGAFHNPVFQPVARRFAEATAGIPVHAPEARLYSPQLRRFVRSADDVRELLNGLLVLPVGFRTALHTLYDEGIETFLECGARQVLSDLVPTVLPAAARAIPLLPGRAQALRFRDTLDGLARRAGAPGPVPLSPAEPVTTTPPAAPQTPPPVPASPVVPATAVGGKLPGRDELLARIRQVYADELQYPLDVFEDDAVELEGELGVSSLKQTQIFVKLLDAFALPTPTAEARPTACRTVPEVADLLTRLAVQS